MSEHTIQKIETEEDTKEIVTPSQWLNTSHSASEPLTSHNEIANGLMNCSCPARLYDPLSLLLTWRQVHFLRLCFFAPHARSHVGWDLVWKWTWGMGRPLATPTASHFTQKSESCMHALKNELGGGHACSEKLTGGGLCHTPCSQSLSDT